VYRTNDRNSVLFSDRGSARELEKPRTDWQRSGGAGHVFFWPVHNSSSMLRGFMMWNLVVYRLILMCTRYVWGCHIGELELEHAVRVDAHIATLAGANLVSVPPPQFVVGACAMALANETSATHCLSVVLATIATPTHCAESAEFLVPPQSGLNTLAPLHDVFVDDGVCSALLFPKLTSTVHGTAGLLGNAVWAMWMRIRQVLHATVGRAPWSILFVQAAWSFSSFGNFVRFVLGPWRVDSATETSMTCCLFLRDVCPSMVHGRIVVTHIHQHVVTPVLVALTYYIPSTTIESTWTWVATQMLSAVWPCFVLHFGQAWTFCVGHCLTVVLLVWHLCLGRHCVRALSLTAALLLATCVLPGYLSSVICMLPWVYSIYPCTRAYVYFVHVALHPSAGTFATRT
jgi:hypothetical protein